MSDLRYAARLLVRSPGFALVAVLALALGIGANTAIFSVVKAVLLAPSPFPEPERLVRLWQSSPEKGEPIDPLSPGSYAAYRDEAGGVFESIGAASDGLFNLTGDGEPEALIGYRFSADFFRVLGVPALLGRTFLSEEDRQGAEPVAVLAHELWQRRYSGDPQVVGRRILLDGKSHTVVGVMPREFKWGTVLVWVPLALDPSLADNHSSRFLRVVARLKPGVAQSQAQRAVEGVARRLAEQRPADHAGWTALVEPMAEAREREVAVRVALGAGRGRLVRLCLAESLLLGLLGGLAGLLVTNWTVDLLLALFPKNLGNVAIPRLDAIHVNGGMLLFALALNVVRGQTPAAQGQEPEVDFRAIGGDYLQALRVRLVRGRLLAESDREDAAPVVVVNETFARRFLGTGEPIGQAIEMRIDSEQAPRWREVVGVVSDLRHHGLAEPPSPEVYFPFRQEPLPLLGFAVRTSPEPMSPAAAVRGAIWEVDPDQPVSHVLSLREMAADTVTLRRASLLLMLAFAALALGLACLGLYGVMAHVVAQRTQEIGVRLAVGASPGDVRRMIVGAGLRTAGAGLAIGLVVSFGVSRLPTSLLYGVSPLDPASLLATAAILMATAILASGVAALRAGRIDPLRALRYE